jgi:chromosome segregation ATPase
MPSSKPTLKPTVTSSLPTPTTVRITQQPTEAESEESVARPKKRLRAQKEEDPSKNLPAPQYLKHVRNVFEDLVALDSASFKEYIKSVRSTRPLSSEENTLVKKINRRINNRESARRSRKEKREITDALESQIQTLNDDLDELRMANATQAAQNAQLRDEIQYSYQLINSNPTLARMYNELRSQHESLRSLDGMED